ncbi:GNAT family N-acetyltransferase [Asticcacaulis endophyticus]|uniref:N-acetyltransferase n=1 Tax=Asticcacaulis endophyticus TaxID=1395890 RepID=A0A918Q3Q1_9CAUL|nr:GNAT family N-acetyltransferase [Asticcacaulis endophyticus]GGZ31153.1 N-acetyltransferase [Asticcacaulis endophyticus]
MDTVTDAALSFRAMTPADLDQAYGLSMAVRWPHRREDWSALLRLGQGFVAESKGQIVGTTMLWPYGADAASLGMVIVAEDYQGQGIGRQLMNAALKAADGRTVQLNATDEGLPLYQKLGFVPVGAIHQHQGSAFSMPVIELGEGERLRPMGTSDRPALIQLDTEVTGLEREGLYRAVFAKAKGIVIDCEGDIRGFALMRRFGRGYSIGPVIARDLNGAKAIISYWLGSNPGLFIRLDVTEESGLTPWLDEAGLTQVGRVVTMKRAAVTKPATDSSLKLFAITSQALG